MLTEKQAKTKWCPLAAANSTNPRKPLCIASNCAAWRWAQKPNPAWKDTRSMMATYPPSDTRFDEPMYIEDKTRGHCGIAGQDR